MGIIVNLCIVKIIAVIMVFVMIQMEIANVMMALKVWIAQIKLAKTHAQPKECV